MASKKNFSAAWRYWAVIAACFGVGLSAGLTRTADRIDNNAYDELSARFAADWTPHSVVVGIDEQTFRERGGTPHIREIEAEALEKIARAQPAAVAIDIILADATDPASDARLEAALRAAPRLILSCDLAAEGWEDPLDRFQSAAAQEPGHVELPEDRQDGVTREIPLERVAAGSRRWALSLATLAAVRGKPILESPQEVRVGGTIIPAPRTGGDRPLWIRYLPEGRIPVISAAAIDSRAELIRGKTVFFGVTALSAARDRVLNPYKATTPGVEAHAQAFETMDHGEFLTAARGSTLFLVCLGIAAAAGAIFGLFSGWPAYLAAAALLGFAHFYLPALFFQHNSILGYSAPAAVAWLCTAGAATHQHFFVRRQLRRSESERSRYQQAIHWAAHEMRTPLTAIQGSSEIMTRYNLPEAKRNQLSEMIHSESKRLARIIQTFLDVERLAEGEMEVKREPIAAAEIVEACMRRAAPLAERKGIALRLDAEVAGMILGDRELMEYAFYNLLTNAIKYSPAETEIRVFSHVSDGELRLAVQDQGMGMNAKEMKNIFKKFYRTERAEASGEAGTGIGLSIVEQIVVGHGGKIGVASEPGKGSCFTIVLKNHGAPPSPAADRRG
ncbi:MAG TPA: CHASE2 domain-containing protein [Bryobacteraceae bacterium]|nr:CHASE2 domain-containing protein [Bryobacteraceae bacterium]